MENRYTHKNRRKFNLKIHLVLVTKYRKALLIGELAIRLKAICIQIAYQYKWNIIAMETDKDHIHILLEYDTTERVCDIVSILKQRTTYYLWREYRQQIEKCYWKQHILWSDGYFVCSIGDASSPTIQKYIESQG